MHIFIIGYNNVSSYIAIKALDRKTNLSICLFGLKLSNIYCTFFCFHVFYSIHFFLGKQFCYPQQFACANGENCLDDWLTCNGENDCGDNSDEIDCG